MFLLMNITSKSVFAEIRERYTYFHHLLKFYRDTYVERKPGETANDRNDRAIRTATKWYDEHLQQSQLNIPKAKRIRVVLLTNDAKNREIAQNEGILAISVDEYVKSLTEHPLLQDKLKHKTYEVESSKNALFPPHLSPAEIHEGIKSGALLQGSFMASRENYLEGSVNVEGIEKFVSSKMGEWLVNYW